MELNQDYSLLTPEFCLAGLAALIITLDLFAERFPKSWLSYVAAAGLIGVAGMSFGWANKESDFAGLIYVDDYTTFFRIFFLAVMGPPPGVARQNRFRIAEGTSRGPPSQLSCRPTQPLEWQGVASSPAAGRGS